MRHFCTAHTLLLAALGVASACDGGSSAPPADRVAVEIAPLALPGIGDARWSLTVANGSGETVWTRELTADQHGDGAGSVSYVGPCDADDNDNTVTVELLELFDGGGATVSAATYINPGPLTRSFTCAPNADVAVAFDVTIARAAQQGFFDVAVSFSNIFCSAKLDCVDDGGAPLELLHDASGARAPTVVMALACTADVTGATTELYLDPIVVTCSDRAATVDPTAGPGRLTTDAGITQSAATPTLFAAQVTRGGEQLAGKLYWNTLLGLDPGATSCTLTAQATAYPGTLDAGQTPAGSTWPVIDWNVPLNDAGGALVCTHHAIDGDPTGVATSYADPDAPETFAYVFNGAATCNAVLGCGAPALVTSGLILHLDPGDPASYPGSGAAWTDLSSAGNDGTLYGNPTYSAAGGGSLVFDGAGDYALMGNVAYDRAAFSVFTWHRFSQYHVNWNGIALSKWYTGAGTAGNEWTLGALGQTGPLPFGAGIQANGVIYTAANTVSPQLNTWYFIGFVIENNTLRFYENGVLVAETPFTGTVQTTTQALAAMAFMDFTNHPAIGSVGRVTMYGRALSDAEVLESFEFDRARYGL
ncbi:MAG: LamG domain-containing protein [Deltaproteobacteria bacterium]|nr:MAG: LamG domain-containing protein [Deltaproteobacteria bacterium]